jgi:L-cysteine S-thiosulfotransferase
MRWSAIFSAAVFAVCVVSARGQTTRPEPPRPGREFQSAETRHLEADEAANPGLLWMEQGRSLWSKPEGTAAKSCAGCHGGDVAGAMQGVATRYPAVDPASGRLLNIEGRINQCRTERQGAPKLPYEHANLLALTALVTHASRGLPRAISIDGPGQLNVACAQCHDAIVGKRLRGDTNSQGQTDGWPAYRLEWQTLGSLQRRLRACSLGVRAEILDFDAPEYLALELYLAWRGGELPLSAPGVRR